MYASAHRGKVALRSSAHLDSQAYEPGDSFIDPELEPIDIGIGPGAELRGRKTINDIVAEARHASEQGPDGDKPILERAEFLELRQLEALARNLNEKRIISISDSPGAKDLAREMERVFVHVRALGEDVSAAKLEQIIKCCDVRVLGDNLDIESMLIISSGAEEYKDQRAAFLARSIAFGTIFDRARDAVNPIERIAAARVAAAQVHLYDAHPTLRAVFSTDPEPAVIQAVARQIRSVAAIEDPEIREFVRDLFEAGQKHLSELSGKLGDFSRATDPSKFRYYRRCCEASTELLAVGGRAADGSGMGGFS